MAALHPCDGSDRVAARERVLVVDDDAPTRRLLRDALGLSGFDVVEAPDGPTALEILGREQISLVLLDSRMPGMNGVEVLAHLRSRPELAMLPVLFVTGDGEVERVVAGLQAGADDYVVKPFEVPELVARVQARLRDRRVWKETLERRLSARAAVARRVRTAIGREGDLVAAAVALCRETARLPSVAGVALIELDRRGHASMLALQGDVRWGVRAGELLPPPAASYLRARASLGPWIETGDGDVGSAVLLDARAACAPIGRPGDPVALLVLSQANEPADESAMRSMLGDAVDLAEAADAALGDRIVERAAAGETAATIAGVVARRDFVPHYQPIARLVDYEVQGVEALTRFADGAPPATRFSEASSCGLGVALEMATLERSVAGAAALGGTRWLSVNVSPQLLLEGSLLGPILADAAQPVVVELSEHDRVEDYAALRSAISDLPVPTQLSVDDAGSGFASLRHILELRPEFMKLDRSWICGIDADPARQALVAGLRQFATEAGCTLVAEGIERGAELQAVIDLGVDLGQGFLLGRPRPAAALG